MSDVSADEARAILQRFVNSHFRHGDHARISIPARPERDDDLRLYAFIYQSERLRAENAALREQLAARETVPVAVPADVLEKLIKRWGELRDKAWLKDTASNDEIGHAFDECVIDLRIAVDALKGGKNG